MKKLLLLSMALACLAMVKAAPVDMETAKAAAQKFVASSFQNTAKSTDLQWVFTGMADRGEACFYVFNVGETGFVIVSADDRFRPITGYSEEGVFATENRSPELDYYLEKIIEARTSGKAVLYEDASSEWMSLLQEGMVTSRNEGKGAFYLCETTWNQNSPYNYYAPQAASGPGGRCYAGCVATAMSQLMKYWEQPVTGMGSHSYYSSYGHLSANFGATTYNWEKMPLAVHATSSTEEIESVALLMYHCGVSVDMMFSPNGSGAYSDDVPYSMQHYFSYTNAMDHLYRYYYSLEQWKNILKAQFDLGWPVYYSGYSESGGHAFVCDGYDDNDLFHFNWGWGGSSDGWFVIDEIDYANWASIIRNYVPDFVYENMPLNPENFMVESLGDADFSATLSWTNPTHNIHNEALESIEKVVVCRDGKPIHTFDNPAPGETMSFTDHYLPTVVSYSVYAVVNGAKGKKAKVEQVALGPTCDWTIEMTSSDPEGWKGASIVVTDGKGYEINSLSLTTASETRAIVIPQGMISFFWNKAELTVDAIHFEIKNAEGEVVTSFDGGSKDLDNGLFYRIINACQEGDRINAPVRLTANKRDSGVLLQWEMEELENCSFFIYRDGTLYDIVDEKQYVDTENDGQFHSYYVTAYNGLMESDPSKPCNVLPESDRPSPTAIQYTLVSQDRIRLSWNAPQAEGLSGYRVYRRTRDGILSRIKNITSNSCEINMNALPCDLYDFFVTAYYSQAHQESAFGSSYLNPSLNYVEVNKTVIPMRLDCDVMEEGVKLVWLTALKADQYAIYRNGILIAEGVTESEYLDETADSGQEYCYTVVGSNALITSNPSNVICVDWSTQNVDEANMNKEVVSMYPNPADEQLTVTAKGLKQIVVLNLLGQVVLTKEVKEEMTVLDLRTLTAGTYFIRVITEKGTMTEKFLKR